MPRQMTLTTLLVSFFVLILQPLEAQWTPPSRLSRPEIVQDSQNVLAMPRHPIESPGRHFSDPGSGDGLGHRRDGL